MAQGTGRRDGATRCRGRIDRERAAGQYRSGFRCRRTVLRTLTARCLRSARRSGIFRRLKRKFFRATGATAAGISAVVPIADAIFPARSRGTNGAHPRVDMKSLLIVWHSMTTGAQQMAHAAAQGAQAAGDISVNLSSARDTGAGEVLAADGFLFVTPENLASMSGMMKD